ncbi:sulfotransferase [Ruegeria sp.]|uniref:sulfotransferase n=1 Tax=Ruegeria sp. TaxID=1879320 RepID=UPI003B5C172A
MMQAVLVSLFAVAGFICALWWTNIAGVARTVITASLTGVSSLFDNQLSDREKERAARQAGIRLLIGGGNIAWRIALALALAGLPIWLADRVGFVAGGAVLDVMLRVDYIVIVSVLAIVVVKGAGRLRKPVAPQQTKDPLYSPVDQFVHNFAFASPAILKFAARVEGGLTAKSSRPAISQPIFVTSLARGGTTAVLNALHDAPEIATHIYRDMPFVTAPVMWNKLAGGQKRSVRRQARAHGDGMQIDLNSAEALEEVVWKMFWPQNYTGATIPLWKAEDQVPQANRFLHDHMASIIRARNVQAPPGTQSKTRYCSKNNANIARIPYLLKAFPDCRIVVPIRRPECHAMSLLRQHLNFSSLQNDDSFVTRYMADIGHYEFGNLHKPFLFPDLSQGALDAHQPDYWLDYWTCAFQEILRYKESCIFVLQDDLRSTPQATMMALYKNLGLSAGDQDFPSYFHSQPDVTETEAFTPERLQQAQDLYAAVQDYAQLGQAKIAM